VSLSPAPIGAKRPPRTCGGDRWWSPTAVDSFGGHAGPGSEGRARLLSVTSDDCAACPPSSSAAGRTCAESNATVISQRRQCTGRRCRCQEVYAWKSGTHARVIRSSSKASSEATTPRHTVTPQNCSNMPPNSSMVILHGVHLIVVIAGWIEGPARSTQCSCPSPSLGSAAVVYQVMGRRLRQMAPGLA